MKLEIAISIVANTGMKMKWNIHLSVAFDSLQVCSPTRDMVKRYREREREIGNRLPEKRKTINKLLAAEEARNCFAILMKMNIEDDSLNLICAAANLETKVSKRDRRKINFCTEPPRKRIKISISLIDLHLRPAHSKNVRPETFWDLKLEFNWMLLRLCLSFSVRKTKASHGKFKFLSRVGFFFIIFSNKFGERFCFFVKETKTKSNLILSLWQHGSRNAISIYEASKKIKTR